MGWGGANLLGRELVRLPLAKLVRGQRDHNLVCAHTHIRIRAGGVYSNQSRGGPFKSEQGGLYSNQSRGGGLGCGAMVGDPMGWGRGRWWGPYGVGSGAMVGTPMGWGGGPWRGPLWGGEGGHGGDPYGVGWGTMAWTPTPFECAQGGLGWGGGRVGWGGRAIQGWLGVIIIIIIHTP